MFGYRVAFSGTADLMALFSIRINSRWLPPPSWIISNGHISNEWPYPQRLTIYLYSAHRAVIFAIAQLSCYSCCYAWNLRNPAKLSENSNVYNSRSSKVIIDLGVNRKRICNFLLVINSNFGRISCSFRDIDTFSCIACFPNPTIVWRHPAEEHLALSK